MWKTSFPSLVLIDLVCESQASASTELTSDRLRKGNDELCSMTVEQLKPSVKSTVLQMATDRL